MCCVNFGPPIIVDDPQREQIEHLMGALVSQIRK